MLRLIVRSQRARGPIVGIRLARTALARAVELLETVATALTKLRLRERARDHLDAVEPARRLITGVAVDAPAFAGVEACGRGVPDARVAWRR